MAEDRQPASITEGANPDMDDELPAAAKSAEDRKAAAALSKLDTHKDDDETTSKNVDQDAVNRAMSSLGGDAGKKTEVKKVKVDAADVALLVDELELTKTRATDLLKAHDGDAVKAMRAYVSAN